VSASEAHSPFDALREPLDFRSRTFPPDKCDGEPRRTKSCGTNYNPAHHYTYLDLVRFLQVQQTACRISL
jgi:hypothetical protein